MIDTLIITDTETTGLDPATEKCIEVAVIVFSVKSACILESYSSLIYGATNAAEKINRITPESLLQSLGASDVWNQVSGISAFRSNPTAFMAHRAEFDKGFYPPDIASLLPWICSKYDCEWLRGTPGASLVELALAHDVPVHANHRALTDCLLLAKILERSVELGMDLGLMLERAMRPKIKVQALVSYDDKQKAKDKGFGWDGKIWSKMIAIEDTETTEFDFKTKVI